MLLEEGVLYKRNSYMLGSPPILVTCLITISGLLHWSRTKPAMSPRYVYIRQYKYYTTKRVLFHSIDIRHNALEQVLLVLMLLR